ncbi:MAG: ferrochelatase [Proteobacteria bacterium]|nr:ferrochelatase [Pseudomonadota bacterium]
MPAKTAVLLTNLGTPETLSRASVKRFLNQFLSDPRVVEIPRLPWWLLLNGIILPLRSGKTLQGYERIWTDAGSPLMAYALRQQSALQQKLGNDITVVLAMRYGNPSFETVVGKLMESGLGRLIVLPLYPQNSATTTATTFYHLADSLAKYRNLPSVHFIDSYYEHPAYIEALSNSVRAHWQKVTRQNHLLLSFHGLPQINIDRGDPYYDQCQKTAALLVEQLGLDEANWSLCFQSRFGKQVWLKPYTSDILNQLATSGTKAVDILCPGFSADCLETLDEIKIEYRDLYMAQGGEHFHYIPALNDNSDHIEMMRDLVQPYISV